MRDSSVLEAGRVERVLAKLRPVDRRTALAGLALLARGAKELMKEARDA